MTVAVKPARKKYAWISHFFVRARLNRVGSPLAREEQVLLTRLCHAVI